MNQLKIIECPFDQYLLDGQTFIGHLKSEITYIITLQPNGLIGMCIDFIANFPNGIRISSELV